MRILRSHEDIEIAWLKLEDLDEDIEMFNNCHGFDLLIGISQFVD